jgi:hypothetical protein
LAFLYIIIARLADTWSNASGLCFVLVQILAGMLMLQTKFFCDVGVLNPTKHIPVANLN